MALAVVAAASPAINAGNNAAALSAPAVLPPAALTPTLPLAIADNKQNAAVGEALKTIDASKMGVWVPCSESECMKDMTPEQQAAFKRDCEKMQLTRKASGAEGKSRVSSGGAELNFFQMIIPEKDAARLALNNQRVTTVPALHVVNEKAVGNRPAGKNLHAPMVSSAAVPAQISPRLTTPAPVAPAIDDRRNDAYALKGSVVAPHAPISGPIPHETRHDQVPEQIPEDAIAIPAPNANSTGDKSSPKQMMLFFPDPADKLTPEQQHEWAQKFNKSMSEMSPKERESWMQEVQRSMSQTPQTADSAKHVLPGAVVIVLGAIAAAAHAAAAVDKV
ncbi:hypothetical protein GGI21_004422, partial [Coemansia aciculifera]